MTKMFWNVKLNKTHISCSMKCLIETHTSTLLASMKFLSKNRTLFFFDHCDYLNERNSPSSLSVNPAESRNSLVLFPSQMCMFFCCKSLALVLPLINQRSSSATPRKNTRLVVSRGKVLFRKLYRIWDPKILRVPTPVRSNRLFPFAIIRRVSSRYCISSSFCWLLSPFSVPLMGLADSNTVA